VEGLARITGAASNAVQDAYDAAKRALGYLLGDEDEPHKVIEAEETEPGHWQARLDDEPY
jgi:hypothetical protein